MHGIGAERLGLAIELAHRHAHREEEAEGVGPERGTTGRRRAQPREAQPVAQRAEQQLVGGRAALALVQRLQPQPHPQVEHPPLEGRGVHHLGAHLGRDLLPQARREQHEGRADLAEIGHHRLGLLDEVDLHAREQPPPQRIDLLHDPGQRQDRDVLILRPLGVGLQIGRAMPHDRATRQHRQLRPRRGARCRAEHRDVVAARRRDQRLPGLRLGVMRRLPARNQLAHRQQPRVVVFPHAARVAVDDVPQGRCALADGQQLVDLLLILGDHHRDAGEGQQIGDLVIQRIPVEAERARAQRMRRDLAHHPVRPIVADQPDHVAGADAQGPQPERDAARARLVLAPGDAAPDAELLLAQRHLAGMRPRIPHQQLRQGIRVAHTAAGSSMSCTTSSASPR